MDAEAEADGDANGFVGFRGPPEDAKRGSSGAVAVGHAVFVQPTLGGLRDERLVMGGSERVAVRGQRDGTRFAVARVESSSQWASIAAGATRAPSGEARSDGDGGRRLSRGSGRGWGVVPCC